MKVNRYRKFRSIAIAICLSLSLGLLFNSCEDDEKITEVVLQSFGPSGVKHGDMIKFIGLNLNKVTAIVLKPNIEITDFVSQSSTLIEIIVPQDAEAGKVILKTPQGDIESKTMLSFEVPVLITSITPAEVKPGTNLTISGDKVNWIESVTFTDGVSVTEFESKSVNEVVVQVPLQAQTGFLVFATGGTDPMTFASDDPLQVTVPEVTAFNPSSLRHTEVLTITGTDLDLVTAIVFGGDFTVQANEFVSQSVTEIQVAVPASSLSGTLTLKQASPVDVVTTQEISIILPVGTNITPSPAIPGSDDITITGTDLDLVAELGLPGVAPIPAASFVSHSSTQIVVSVPDGALSGGITYTTIHGYSNNLGVLLLVPGEGPPPLAVTMFDDEVFYGGGDWSWGTVVSDQANAEQFYSGSVSWKFQTDSDGGVSAGGMSPVDASGQNVFVFSLYGGPGTDGAQVAAILGDDGGDKWDSYNSVTLVEGQWTEYQIDLANYPTVNLSSVTRWIFKVEGITGTTIYVDRVGFDPGGPPALAITLFDESVNFNGGDWSWNTLVSDQASTEQSYTGDISWKFETDSEGGVSAGGLDPVDASGATVFKFALYGGPGTDGVQVAAILGDENGDKWDSYNSVTLAEGQWTEYSIDLSNYGTVNLSSVQRWIFKVEGITASTIYVDYVGFD